MPQPGPETSRVPFATDWVGQVARPTTLSCQVWFADLGAERPEHLALLDEVERGRRVRYQRDVDRTRFTVAAALLRLVVAHETGTGPGSVRIDRSCEQCGAPHGKPRVLDAGLHVSVSHSGDRVAVAMTRDAPVGVDVEVITERDVAGLAHSVLSDAEPVSRTEDFYTYWCRKESVVKATGDGLRVPLIGVVVSPASDPARLVSYQGVSLASSMCDLAAGSGYAAAVTVMAEGELAVGIHDAATVM